MPSSSPASSRALRIALAGTTALALTAGLAVVADPADAAGHRLAVSAAKPSWASASADRGAVADDTTVQFELALALPDEQGAQDFALAVATPGSAQYRQYLSPADWIARFAPTQAAVDDLTSAAVQAGLTVTAVPTSRLFLLVQGSAGDVDAFFAARLHRYAVDGDTRVAAAGAATLPAPIARRVAAVSFTPPRITHGPSVHRKTTTSACSASWGQHRIAIPKAYGQRSASTPICGYTAQQLRTIAGVTGAATGADQTIAVIDAFGASTMGRDLATYSSRNGLPAAAYSEVVDRSAWQTSYGCTAANWQPEQALDLEAAHAVAPDAHLVYVGADDCGYGFDVATSKVLDQGLASIVSNSWGTPALDTTAAENGDDETLESIEVSEHQHLQAAGQGVGLYYASGDFGDDAVLEGEAAVDFPASSPFVTAVGGTAVGLDAHGRRVFTAPYGDNVATGTRGRWAPSLPGGFVSGAGGGVSSLFTAPAYQRGVVPTSLSNGMRASSDVSALASSVTGFAVGYRAGAAAAYRTQSFGGTSLATPIVAAQVAVAQQASGRRLGFLNPALYALAKRDPGAFRDVVPSATRRIAATRTGKKTLLLTIDRDGSLKARRGFDLATGLGELTSTTLTALGRL